MGDQGLGVAARGELTQQGLPYSVRFRSAGHFSPLVAVSCTHQAQQRELTVRHVQQTEKELGHQLRLQREQYEAAIQRHLAFIDQVFLTAGASAARGPGWRRPPGCLTPSFFSPFFPQLIEDKKVLSERCEAVVAELKQADQKYSKKISQMQEQHELVRDGAGGVRGGDVGPPGAHLGPVPRWCHLGELQLLGFWGAGRRKWVSAPEVCPGWVGGTLSHPGSPVLYGVGGTGRGWNRGRAWLGSWAPACTLLFGLPG